MRVPAHAAQASRLGGSGRLLHHGVSREPERVPAPVAGGVYDVCSVAACGAFSLLAIDQIVNNAARRRLGYGPGMTWPLIGQLGLARWLMPAAPDDHLTPVPGILMPASGKRRSPRPSALAATPWPQQRHRVRAPDDS
jgi:hypothetical protein